MYFVVDHVYTTSIFRTKFNGPRDITSSGRNFKVAICHGNIDIFKRLKLIY